MDQLAPFLTPANIATYAVAINFAAFAAFGIDKMLAEARARRIAEANLLALALLGGSPGAYAGRHVFRHKTRKQPFSGELHGIAMLQVARWCFMPDGASRLEGGQYASIGAQGNPIRFGSICLSNNGPRRHEDMKT